MPVQNVRAVQKRRKLKIKMRAADLFVLNLDSEYSFETSTFCVVVWSVKAVFKCAL